MRHCQDCSTDSSVEAAGQAGLTHEERHRIISAERNRSNTCDHIRKKIPDPVRSPIVKLMRRQLVVESVMIIEFCLLHVFLPPFFFVPIVSGVDCGLSGGHKVVLAQYSILPSPQMHLGLIRHNGSCRLGPEQLQTTLASFGRSTTTYARAQSRRRALVFNIHTTLKCCGLTDASDLIQRRP